MLCLITLLGFVVVSSGFTFSASPAQDLEPLFTPRPVGFTGADVGTSVRLDAQRTLWLFGDTLVGYTRDGKRQLIGSIFPRNTIATVPNATALPTASEVQFYWRWDNVTGPQPDSFFKAPALPTPDSPVDAPSRTNWLWVFTGMSANSSLYLLAGQYKNVSSGGPFNFAQVSTVVLTVDNTAGDPLKWQYKADHFDVDKNVTWANAIAPDPVDDYVWILGGISVDGAGTRGTVISRMSKGALAAKQWSNREYLKEGATVADRVWVPGPIPTASLARLYTVSGETTLHFHPYLQRWFSLYFDGFLSPRIVMMSTDWLEHQWQTNLVYTIPAPFNDASKYFCYAVKAHPELARSADEIVFTYETNAFNLGDVMDNTIIYVPRFVRAKIQL